MATSQIINMSNLFLINDSSRQSRLYFSPLNVIPVRGVCVLLHVLARDMCVHNQAKHTVLYAKCRNYYFKFSKSYNLPFSPSCHTETN